MSIDRMHKRYRDTSPSSHHDYKRSKGPDDRYNADGYGSHRTDSRSYHGVAPQHEDDPIYNSYTGVGGYVVRDYSDETTLFSRPNTGINFDKYDNIKIEVEGHGSVPPIITFDEAKLHPQLMANIHRSRYDKPTPVQKYSIPIILDNRDLMASAQTGSGKTGGFLFPIIDGLLKSGTTTVRPQYGRPSMPYAVILAPTRELVVQIYQECLKFVYQTGLRAVCVYGGTSKPKQCREVERGVDIMIATCGRLQDLCNLRKVSFSQVRYLCLDEADRMLDMGFEPQIRSLVEQLDMPPVRVRRTMMFSATFPLPIQKMAADFLDQYLFLKVGQVGSTSENITQVIKWVEEYDKDRIVAAELRAITGRTLIFVETRRKADRLARHLQSCGFNALPIHGDLKQHEREYALEDFKVGRCTVLTATEVAARGLDVENIEHVVNYDLPNNIDDYVHRIGRTGRAGNIGLATAFYNEKNSCIAKGLIDRLRDANQQIPDWLEKEKYSKNSYASGKGRRGFQSNGGAVRSRPGTGLTSHRSRPYGSSSGTGVLQSNSYAGYGNGGHSTNRYSDNYHSGGNYPSANGHVQPGGGAPPDYSSYPSNSAAPAPYIPTAGYGTAPVASTYSAPYNSAATSSAYSNGGKYNGYMSYTVPPTSAAPYPTVPYPAK